MSVTREEEMIVQTVHAIFEKYDLDKDGYLTIEESKPFLINFKTNVIGMDSYLAYNQ